MVENGLHTHIHTHTHIVIFIVNININNYKDLLLFLVLSNKFTKNSRPIQSQMTEQDKFQFYETQSFITT